MQLNPQEVFYITRLIEDPVDTNTYYVKAVIRKASDSSILETILLEDKGDRLFSKAWSVPAQINPDGDYITITTEVYTDSGYTTKSPNYGEKLNTYAIQSRFNRFSDGGGGGADISYKKIAEIVKEEVKKAIPEKDDSKLLGAIDGITIPEQKETSLEPVLSQIDVLNQTLNSLIASVNNNIKNIPQPEKIDLTPLLQSNRQDNSITEENVVAKVNEVGKQIMIELKRVDEFITEVQRKFDMTGQMRTAIQELKAGINKLPIDEQNTEEKPKKKRSFLNR